MQITERALGASRLTLFAALLILVAGVVTFLNFPSQEEPPITIRDAMVAVYNPGLSSERVETLLARPLEERLRELAEIRTVIATVRPGGVLLQITARDGVADLATLWQRVRSKASEAAAAFPEGSIGPFVNDDFGRVAVASVAVTAPGFSMGEMREPLKGLREQLQSLPGLERISFHGLQEERVYLEFQPERLAGLGLSPAAVMQQLQAQNIVLAGGAPSAQGQTLSVVVAGELRGLDALRRLLISLPRSAAVEGAPLAAPTTAQVPLGDLARIQLLPADPPESAAVYQGQAAVVMAVAMAPGRNIAAFGASLRERLQQLEAQLPVGFTLKVVTFQSDVVAREMRKMNQVMLETVAIVLIVVMLFLGWRTGLVVGAIVPLTILTSLLVMNALGIALHSVSIAAIIIALGLLVDNGIVIAEDIERRLVAGEERRSACIEAGRSLAVPLLTSTLAIVLAFSPFLLGETSTNEYLRPLALVLTITLLASWGLCLTVTPLLCLYFAKAHATATPGDPADNGAHNTRFYRGYRRIIETVLLHKIAFVGAMLAALAAAVWVMATLPYDFLPRSDRLQFQIPLQLQAGSDSRQTLQKVQSISRWLADDKVNPEVVDSIGYVADGGPRIVLGLNPPLPAPHVGYFTVNVKPGSDVGAVIGRAQRWLATTHPDVLAEPKRFSLGATDAGVAVVRLIGPDEAVLRDATERLKTVMRGISGMASVRDDWGPRVPRLGVDVDQAVARRAGISSEDIAGALQARFSGVIATTLRDGDIAVPVLLRGAASERLPAAELGNTLVYPASGGAPVPLSAVASVTLAAEPSTIVRRNLTRAVTVEGRHANWTAQALVDHLHPQLTALTAELPAGYRVDIGGEIEDAADANQALLTYMPHALVALLLLFTWQFNSFRKLVIIFACIPFVLIGAALALKLSSLPFGFMATFGLLALAGIIVNNAVLLLERIEAEVAEGQPRHAAIVNAAVQRLRPIVMTKLTCVAGLVPLMLFGGPLWTGMAVTIIGGLLLGSLVSLGLVPVLYELLFGGRMERAAVSRAGVPTVADVGSAAAATRQRLSV